MMCGQRQLGRITVVSCFIIAAGWGLASCRRDSGPGPSPVCTISLAPPNRTFSSDPAQGSVEVTTSAASCTWTAAAGAAWISVTAGGSGTGSGVVQYTVASNESADARASVITVGDQAHSITQQGRQQASCTYTLSPNSATIDREGGTGSFAVNAASNCQWTALSNAEWLAIDSGAQGTGDGTVVYKASANGGAASRAADIVIADQKFTLTQSGLADPGLCSYTVDPTQFNPCMAPGTLTTRVETQDVCKWTVTSDVPWLTITTGGSGTGSSNIEVSYSDNYDAPREGRLMVRWPTVTEGQNVRVAQAGCVYGTSQSVFTFEASGGTGSFTVVQQSQPYECGGPLQNACEWTATPTVPWITVTTSMPRVGDDNVSFGVAANPLSTARSGTIVVRDRVIQITQAAP